MKNTLDIRKLNQWLKTNVPFSAKARREPHMQVVISAESSNDLHGFAAAITAEFGLPVRVYGLNNYLTIIA